MVQSGPTIGHAAVPLCEARLLRGAPAAYTELRAPASVKACHDQAIKVMVGGGAIDLKLRVYAAQGDLKVELLHAPSCERLRQSRPAIIRSFSS